MKKKKNLFNPAFRDLRERLQKTEEDLEATRPPLPDPVNSVDLNDFLEAMSDVTPLRDEKKRVDRNPRDTRPAHPAPDEEREVMDHLQGLVKGRIEMDMTFSDEYMEGSVVGLSPKIMRRLKKGRIPVQDFIDLHGLSSREAETGLREFLIKNYRLGRNCVLVVHGRGLNSPDSFPVLKKRLPVWLNRGPIKKLVLAFSTARTYDGGTGAVYVLLRKR